MTKNLRILCAAGLLGGAVLAGTGCEMTSGDCVETADDTDADAAVDWEGDCAEAPLYDAPEPPGD